MLKHSKIDEAIREVEEELNALSMESEREIERIRQAYEQKKSNISTALAHLQQARAELTGVQESIKTPPIISDNQTNNKVEKKQSTTENYKNFAVREEVRKITADSNEEYSPKSVKELLEKKFPGVLDALHESSVHRALNDLVALGEVVKVGKGKYRRLVSNMRENEQT